MQNHGSGGSTGDVVRRAQRKRGNLGLKDLGIVCNAGITAVHTPQGTLNARPAGVLERLTRLQKGLLPHNAQAPHLLSMPSCVLNDPAPRNNLCRQEATISQRDRVRKGEHLLTGVRLVGQELGID